MTQQEFRAEYETIMAQLKKGLEAFPWESREAYGNWCAQTYYYVFHSTHLLAFTAALIPVREMKMHYRFVAHLKEESGHEMMAKKDLEGLGFKPEAFPELTETRSFYQTQYHLIQNVHPLSFFGYIFMLEGAASEIGPRCYARVKDAHGEKCANFWRTHAEEDPDHIRKAFESVEKLDEKTMDIIALNLRDSTSRYLSMCETMAKATKPATRKAG